MQDMHDTKCLLYLYEYILWDLILLQALINLANLNICYSSQEAEAEKITCAKHFEKNLAI